MILYNKEKEDEELLNQNCIPLQMFVLKKITNSKLVFAFFVFVLN